MALNPEVFVWARETAGLSVENAAAALGFRDGKSRSAADRLSAIERGDEAPSISVLRKMADKYHRSLLVFYLEEPPRAGNRGQDFRTTAGAPSPTFDPLVDTLIRRLRGRHEIVRNLLEDDEAPELDFIGSARPDESTETLAEAIASRLDFSLESFRRKSSAEKAFAYLRERLETAGVFVLLAGDLGSHHSQIPVSVFRGYAIADPIAPFVLINDQDARAAWSFTALHETVHLWLGQTGVSSAVVEAGVEQYCNEVASRILLPSVDAEEWVGAAAATPDEIAEKITAFARSRNVSRSMAAYRLFRSRLIRRDLWQSLSDRFREEWSAARSQAKAEQAAKESGPDYYTVRRHRLGAALVSLVDRSLAEGALTYTKAARVLGVNPRSVEALIRPSSAAGGT